MRVRHQHRSIHGALRGAVPLKGVGRDSAAARTQGKAFPFIESVSKTRKKSPQTKPRQTVWGRAMVIY
jgi:hypothetical protein